MKSCKLDSQKQQISFPNCLFLTLVILRWSSKGRKQKQFLKQHVTRRVRNKKITKHNKLFVRYFNILPDLMSFICMWRFGLWSFFWISSCFPPPFKPRSAAKSTLCARPTKQPLWPNRVFPSVVFFFHCSCFFRGIFSGPSNTPPQSPNPPLLLVGALPLFLSISWSVLLYLGGQGWYLHPPTLPPAAPSAWYDLNWCPAGAFFPRTPQTGRSGDGAAAHRAFSSSPIKIKAPVVWRGPLGSWL